MNRTFAAAFAIIVVLPFASAVRADDAPAPTVHFPAFRAGAFADLIYTHPTSPSGKDRETGEVDLYASQQFSGDWSALGEVLTDGEQRELETIGDVKLVVNPRQMMLHRLLTEREALRHFPVAVAGGDRAAAP